MVGHNRLQQVACWQQHIKPRLKMEGRGACRQALTPSAQQYVTV